MVCQNDVHVSRDYIRERNFSTDISIINMNHNLENHFTSEQEILKRKSSGGSLCIDVFACQCLSSSLYPSPFWAHYAYSSYHHFSRKYLSPGVCPLGCPTDIQCLSREGHRVHYISLGACMANKALFYLVCGV